MCRQYKKRPLLKVEIKGNYLLTSWAKLSSVPRRNEETGEAARIDKVLTNKAISSICPRSNSSKMATVNASTEQRRHKVNQINGISNIVSSKWLRYNILQSQNTGKFRTSRGEPYQTHIDVTGWFHDPS